MNRCATTITGAVSAKRWFVFTILTLITLVGVPTLNQAGAAPTRLDLSKLGGLKNYVARVTDNGVVVGTYHVHSATDWEYFTGGRTPLGIDIGRSSYGRVPVVSGSTVTFKWERLGLAQPYGHTPYPSYASGFAALNHVSGVKLVRGATCDVANTVGHVWRFAAKVPGAVFPHVSACVADHSGALLTYVQAPIQSFAVLSVGDVPVIRLP